MKERSPVLCSARCSDVAARHTWSASSTMLTLERIVSTVRSRRDRWSTSVPGRHAAASRCGTAAVVARDTSLFRARASRALPDTSTFDDGHAARTFAAKDLARSWSRSYKVTVSMDSKTVRR